jgi:hypothetical protein|eukprot:CAMPEP_0174359702 /NCGR_PEP_ID=MMETSP0811_2-20130205/49989_1 /TAXON_ID=73025 ORGANISM="Eutreptiella gymnastica-like, Strain CCMP1594" /NCGR_SAMPLE_ID=MMETSP0811_2 /ASSEMBLY_ACC=CAM_ASM_000667 /LENGTH=158 /DNA_ID=CAMNT_0015494651 /DNA_START=1128 /DNA_END=1604 /DNA_ORIENTATION=+
MYDDLCIQRITLPGLQCVMYVLLHPLRIFHVVSEGTSWVQYAAQAQRLALLAASLNRSACDSPLHVCLWRSTTRCPIGSRVRVTDAQEGRCPLCCSLCNTERGALIGRGVLCPAASPRGYAARRSSNRCEGRRRQLSLLPVHPPVYRMTAGSGGHVVA